MRLKQLHLVSGISDLDALPKGKLLINTINAHSYNTARKDMLFAEALEKGGVLVPDGASVVKACRFLGMDDAPRERVAGWDLFVHEMNVLAKVADIRQRQQDNIEQGQKKPTVMFLGSSQKVLELITQRMEREYPMLGVETYSPPFVKEFTEEQTNTMIDAVNAVNPDLLWIGMTAPKQEKWAYCNFPRLNIHCHVGTIGAVFDFFAGTSRRAPLWWQRHGIEWLYRLIQNPRRMWRRYIIGNAKFAYYMLGEKLK